MAEVQDIKVIVKNFRSVANADIIINGITVVAGENGSGKSSISKLLYFLYKTVADYERIVKRSLNHSFEDIAQFLEIIVQDLKVPKATLRQKVSELRRGIAIGRYFEIEAGDLVQLVTDVENAFYAMLNNDPAGSISKRADRIKLILLNILQIKKDVNFPELFSKVREVIADRFTNAQKIIEQRPTSVFNSELKNAFAEGDSPEVFEVQEYGDPIVALNKDHLSIPYNIQKAVYIDSPMMFHSDSSNNIHWDDLAELLGEKGDNNHNIAEIISKEIIQGDILAEENPYYPDEFKFKRNDGKIFNLLDVATGIKSFSILQLLLKNGSITDKTLMIIDEPESNLHPQWIIEYARIIVMLNKLIGVKFFLATHNPDMVSAIRYISEKQGTLDKVNFYLAEKAESDFQYNYKYLGNEIDPIFASFNIALDRINQYGI